MNEFIMKTTNAQSTTQIHVNIRYKLMYVLVCLTKRDRENSTIISSTMDLVMKKEIFDLHFTNRNIDVIINMYCIYSIIHLLFLLFFRHIFSFSST